MRLMPRGASKRWQNKWLFLSLNFLHSAPQTRPLQAQIKVLNYSCQIRRFVNRMGSRCDGDRLWNFFWIVIRCIVTKKASIAGFLWFALSRLFESKSFSINWDFRLFSLF